ncbi:MAG: hypothetical protein E6G10_28035 [Actinobacteria bacterium]|nr:MAG: hypothetical protein E6G10_28035 [Actinomycetota bacterium]
MAAALGLVGALHRRALQRPARPALPGRSEHFPCKEEVADYLQAYAEYFELPVCLNDPATSLERVDGRYRVQTPSQTYEAEHVVVSTGAYQRPHVPSIAERLDDEVLQLHSADYRNAAQLADGEVLVVGSANSGAQIAQDLGDTHRVHLARGRRLPRLPRRILGQSLHWWGERVGLIQAPLDSWRGRTQRGDLLVGTSLRQLARRHGVELLPRAVSAGGRTVAFADGRSLDVQTIVWATGFRPDYSWIEVPVFDERGAPRHRRGVSNSPGLYFLGMHLQYSRGSSLIGWVRHDAEFIVDAVARAAARSRR